MYHSPYTLLTSFSQHDPLHSYSLTSPTSLLLSPVSPDLIFPMSHLHITRLSSYSLTNIHHYPLSSQPCSSCSSTFNSQCRWWGESSPCRVSSPPPPAASPRPSLHSSHCHRACLHRRCVSLPVEGMDKVSECEVIGWEGKVLEIKCGETMSEE